MQPREELSREQIALSDPELWRAPEEVIEGAFVTLRREAPVSFHSEVALPPLVEAGPGYWALTKYADITHVSHDTDTFISGKGIAIWDFPPAMQELFHHLGFEDEPRHGRLRRIVSRAFTAGQINHLESVIAEEARRTVDAIIETGEVEFVSEVGGRLPVRIICELLGIPDEYHEPIYKQSGIAMQVADPSLLVGVGAEELQCKFMEILQAGNFLNELLHELVTERQRHPRDDIITTLMTAREDGESLTELEFRQFFMLLAIAGNETVRNALAHGMEALTRYPDQRQLWAGDVERYADSAANEIIRWATPVMHFRRTATRDAVIGGQEIKAGEKVVMFYRSGNRDEQVFDQPYRFDIARPIRPAHVAFGGPGRHYCMGAHLARKEIALMFSELLSRIPDIEMVGTPVRSPGNISHKVDELRCVFTPTVERVA
jgi:methyl-branched lipid omega-hydroxylase